MSEIFITINIAGTWQYDETFSQELIDTRQKEALEHLEDALREELNFDTEEWFHVELSVEQ